ncbi:outer membrane protein assembly factor BamA [Siccirubricoccus deserti]|uniref:Outer membrane protein assembly factor BamA n=1 Tax=Siccirubricoccus deserti TaxID=2013562 RepID=A0A9X0R0W7_9PROT|nr:outer membrane protein assembly factor BamA [Siccirubricoccus deserti]MBC4016823.1 outer membrane protein assembly factor BamA [Siccirubricoccus deserti]GGC52204.1 outer membrane protein assembly factor BamA [Siccirubricoccus deserti]
MSPSSRVLLLAVACLAPGLLPSTAEAQPRPRTPPRATAPAAPAGVVTAIEVRGNQRIEAETVRSYMVLQPGDAYDPDRLDRSLKALFATGLFRDVQMRRDGGTILVEVAENPIVNRVAFEGNRKISDDVLRGEVQMRGRAVFTTQAVQSDRQRIQELYARRGRFAAAVEPKIIQLDQNRVDVVYEIQEGEAALIARINFVGNSAYGDSRLKEVVATKEQAWYRIFSSSDQFDPERLSFDRELLRRFYLRNGYADVQVTNATAELAPDRTGFFVTYTIDEGARYRIGAVNLVSNLRNLDAEAMRGLVQVEEGDWYDGDLVERAAQALQDAANLRGFPFVDVQPRIQRNREDRRVDLTFEINEAPRVFVERIEINGNTRTQDRVIRREFRLAEGDAFNAAQIRRSRQRLRDIGYFSDVQIASAPGSAPDRAVLNTQVVERATGEVSLGGGYSTDAGMLADVGLRERNLLGTGIDARINGTLAQRRSQLDFSVTDPYFLDRNLAAGLDIFYLQRNLLSIASYRERRAGFAVRAGYAFNERLRQTWAYTLTNREIYDISTSASRFITEQQGTTLLSQLGQTLTYDFRDSIIDPRRGGVLRLGTDFAGLGGDVAYLRVRLDGSYFIPFEQMLGDPDYVLSLSGSVGYLESLFNKTDRVIDRFFLGGENLRGFRIAGAGPRDINTSDSLGGRFLWTQSTEMRFPLPLPAELGLIGRAFVDVGALSQSSSGPEVRDDGAPRVGAGVGISWRSPFGLINIDMAQAVVKKSYDETQFFRFGFGTRF